jgi:hypothetical protein
VDVFHEQFGRVPWRQHGESKFSSLINEKDLQDREQPVAIEVVLWTNLQLQHQVSKVCMLYIRLLDAISIVYKYKGRVDLYFG